MWITWPLIDSGYEVVVALLRFDEGNQIRIQWYYCVTNILLQN